MQSSELIIEEAISGKWIKDLAFLFKVKENFRNSVVYDYSSRSLGAKLGYSHNSINDFVSVLKKKGLVQIITKKNGKRNLLFKKVSKNHRCTIKINKNENLKSIQDTLRFKLFEMNHNQQKYAAFEKEEARFLKLKKFLTSRERNRLNKLTKKISPENPLSKEVSFTDKALGNKLGCCTKKARILKRKWAKKGFISYISDIIRVKYVGKAQKYIETLKTGEFISQGWLFRQTATAYTLLTEYAFKKEVGKNDYKKRVNDFLSEQNIIRKAK